MAKLDDFVPLVQPHLSGCPALAVRNAIAQTLSVLCSDTDLWTYEHDDLLLIEGFNTYELSPPAGMIVNRLLSVAIDGFELKGNSLNTFSESTGKPSAYFHNEPNEVVFNKKPDKQYWVKIRCSVIPSPSLPATTDIPDKIFNQWHEVIEHGALYRLMVMPGRTWTDGPAASHHLGEFNRLKNKAKARAMMQSGGSLRVKPISFISRR